jgi:ubiquinol-cytochrome c reductase subunit 8
MRPKTGSPTQKNVITYAMSPNRLNPTSTIFHDAIFNTFRRTRNQILYWVPPLLLAYLSMDWAIERNEYLNSKPGRAEYGDQ